MGSTIVTLPEKRTNEVANGTRCKCGDCNCREILYFNGNQKAVEYKSGYAALRCAVRMGLITREQATSVC